MILLAMDRSIRRFDAQGFLHLDEPNPISKANVCPYYGREIPGWQALGLACDKVYRLLRHPDELAKAAPTFDNLPVLSDHVPVDAESIPDDMIVGSTGTHAAFDGEYLTNKPVIWKRASIDGVVNNRKRQFSASYRYTPDMTPGNYKGVAYDGVMRDIVGNHVALVIEGRAGPDVHARDEQMKLYSRKALLVSGALAGYVRPLLAQDAKVDLTDALKDVTADTLAAKRDVVVAEVVRIATPHLAADKAIDPAALTGLIDAVADVSAGPDVIAADADPKPTDPAPTPAPKPAPIQPQPTPPSPAPAMDEARVQALMADARASALTEAAAIRTAEREVQPVIGEVVAMDSAAAVYKVALDHLGVGLDGIPEAAYGATFRAVAKARPSDQPAPRVAQDATIAKDFNERFGVKADRLVRS